MYLDPPYANTKGMYYGGIDTNVLWNWLESQDSNYILSYDGISGEINSTANVPESVYNKHEYLLSGNSSFKRITSKNKNSIVYESLYSKFK